jgi:hypothetical protein
MKSVVTEAKMTKRFNTGEYEFEEYTLGAAVDPKESGTEVLSTLKKQIVDAFTAPTATASEVEETKEEETKPEKPAKKAKKEPKNAKSKTSATNDKNSDDEDSAKEDSGDDDESVEDDETPDSEDSDSGDDSADDTEESEEDEGGSDDEEEVKKPAKKGAKSDEKGGTKKKHKAKPQTYNRSIEQHKEIFSGVLRSVSPDWKKSDKLKALAKQASEEMEGENFLNENGEVIENFKVLVARLMRGKSK